MKSYYFSFETIYNEITEEPYLTLTEPGDGQITKSQIIRGENSFSSSTSILVENTIKNKVFKYMLGKL